ncbi:Alpha/Beta hydrolase protein [Xylogone sp. PMI_703]|nr:Alpha/Beta hydrolase protein [Xylogone sp. PMI_703]
MHLGPVSWLDCIVFLIFLAPQLIIQVGFFRTLWYGLSALPFLVIKLPLEFMNDHILARKGRSPFVRRASLFEDFAVRCVRYSFRNIPCDIGRIFLCKVVALPFLRFRMLRHGYLFAPITWRKVKKGDLEGLWICEDNSQRPDIVIYYIHGGGFSMGSTYFYLEFMITWLYLLKTFGGFRNPAFFALEYTLVKCSNTAFPPQVRQTVLGYEYILSITGDPSKVCVSGDSAGGTLALSLLLHLTGKSAVNQAVTNYTEKGSIVPAMAILISPWVTLVSKKDKNTSSDFLEINTLHTYARQYVGRNSAVDDPLLSPGDCKDVGWWRRASPSLGFLIYFGSEEVFAPETRDLAALLQKTGTQVTIHEDGGGIHAWPVASLFLSGTTEDRQRGLLDIVYEIRKRMDR